MIANWNKIRTNWRVRWNKTPPALYIAGSYLVVVLASACLLMIPGIVHPNGTITKPSPTGPQPVVLNFSWNFLIALFNCCSAFSDTGLVIGSIGSNYGFGGQCIILILIHVGGIGLITLKTTLLLWIGKVIKHNFSTSYRSSVIMNEERGDIGPQQIRKLVIFNMTQIVILELISTFSLSFIFYNASGNGANLRHNLGQSIWTAFFTSGSAVNNSGMDIILGSQSFQPYSHNYLMQLIVIIDFVVGGLGFITWYDLFKSKCHTKKEHRKSLSLFSKINLIVYATVAMAGVGGVWAVEALHPSKLAKSSSNQWDLFMKVFFNTMSTRNAGFQTCDLNLFQNESKTIHIIMMFIGSAPSSTAGGIRTTTLGVLILTLWATCRQKSQVTFTNRAISPYTIRLSNMIFFTSVGLIITVSWWCVPIVANYQFTSKINIIYMIISGFGTVGLNPIGNILYDSSAAGQIVVAVTMIILMFIGKLGIGNILTMGRKKVHGQSYPVQAIKVG